MDIQVETKGVLLNLSIPTNATDIGKIFLEFCVNKFGGRSELFRVESLDNQTLQNLGKEFKEILIQLGKKDEDSKINSLLYRCDLGPLCDKFSFKGLHFVFSSDPVLDKKEDEMLGNFFLKKVFELFNLVNNFEQVCDHWDGVNKSIMREDPQDKIDYNSSSNYFIYER